MIAENALALAYILPADVFFLPGDRQAIAEMEQPAATETVELKAAEPAATYQSAELVAAAPVIPKIIAEEPVVSAPVIPKIEARPSPAPVAETAAPIAPNQGQATAPVNATIPNFTYSGGFAQKFLVIVSYPAQDLMEPAHLKALESTITRKEMSMNDVAIFNIGKYPGTDLKAIARFFKPKRMLLLGRDSFPIGLAEQPLNQLTLLGTCQLLYSDSFTDMIGNKDKTKAFWEQMKML